jgi:hypothetical protein
MAFEPVSINYNIINYARKSEEVSKNGEEGKRNDSESDRGM